MNYIKRKVIEYLVKDLFNIVTLDEILRVDRDGRITSGGKRLSKEQSARVKKDAAAFAGSYLFEHLLKDMDHFACNKIFYKAKDKSDVAIHQMLLYYNNILRDKVSKLGGVQKK